MDKYQKLIIRRLETIDEVFHFWLNSNGAQHLVRSHDYRSWKEALLHDMSNYFMVEHLKMPSWDVFFNKIDEMEIIHSKLCDFIRNRYKDKMKDTYRLYKTKIGYIRI